MELCQREETERLNLLFMVMKNYVLKKCFVQMYVHDFINMRFIRAQTVQIMHNIVSTELLGLCARKHFQIASNL